MAKRSRRCEVIEWALAAAVLVQSSEREGEGRGKSRVVVVVLAQPRSARHAPTATREACSCSTLDRCTPTHGPGRPAPTEVRSLLAPLLAALSSSSRSLAARSPPDRVSKRTIALVLLCVQNASVSLLTRLSRTSTRPHGTPLYEPAVAVFTAECIKAAVSLSMLARQRQAAARTKGEGKRGKGLGAHAVGALRDLVAHQKAEMVKLAVPAALYALQNTLLVRRARSLFSTSSAPALTLPSRARSTQPCRTSTRRRTRRPTRCVLALLSLTRSRS